jgi:hypothetical protein
MLKNQLLYLFHKNLKFKSQRLKKEKDNKEKRGIMDITVINNISKTKNITDIMVITVIMVNIIKQAIEPLNLKPLLKRLM